MYTLLVFTVHPYTHIANTLLTHMDLHTCTCAVQYTCIAKTKAVKLAFHKLLQQFYFFMQSSGTC